MSDKHLDLLTRELDRLHEILLCSDPGTDTETWAQLQLDRVYTALCPQSDLVGQLLEAAPTEGVQ